MKSSFPCFPFFLCSLIALTTALPARELFVDGTTGDDAHEGTKEKPFKTVSRAVGSVAEGDRIVLAPGIYRETVAMTGAGTKEKPVVLESADPAHPAILSGADALTGWKPLAGSNLKEATHPHAGNIFYTNLDWEPGMLFAGAAKQNSAREPNSGWFSATTTDGKNIQSEQLGSVQSDTLDGAKLFFFLAKGVIQQLSDVQGWSGGKGVGIELVAPLFKGRPVNFTEGDRFYLQNHISFLDTPRDWVVQKTETGYRIFWWPLDKGALERAESPRRTQILDLSDTTHTTVRNLHIRHAAADTNGFGIGCRNTPALEGKREGLTIESCAIYQNQRFGISLNGCREPAIRNNLITDNSYGCTISKSRNILVEENQIAWNLNDGLIVAWDIEDAIVRRNAIHHHSRFAHPDNFQTYRGVKNLLFESNVLVASGQGAHNQQIVDVIVRNNILAGASANVFFLSQSEPDSKNTGTEKEGGGYTLENNTFALFANGAVVLNGRGHQLSANLFDLSSGKYGYGGKVPSTAITSHNNRFHLPEGSSAHLAGFFESKSIRHTSLATLQDSTGLEEGSVSGSPGFPSAPQRVVSLDGTKIHQCTAARLVYDGTDVFKVGDHLEFDFDGVDRVVKEADASSVVIDPPLESAPLTTVLMANWGKNPVGKIDLANTTGDKRGSSLDFESYLRGDFNNDGKRDVPPWPEGLPSPRKTH